MRTQSAGQTTRRGGRFPAHSERVGKSPPALFVGRFVISIRMLGVAAGALAAVLGAPSKHHHYANALRRSQTREGGADVSADAAQVPLLVVIFTQRSNVERRRTQRSTWLRHRWQRGEAYGKMNGRPQKSLSSLPAAWRYVYVQARDGKEQTEELDTVVGDVVTLSAVRESYADLVYKTLEALRWATHHVPFGALLKTDDDSIVHVGRAAMWLHVRTRLDTRSMPTLYAGRVFNDSQVIRHDFTKRNLLHPEWYPDDFTKWAVPYEALSTAALVHGYYYPPYCSGGGYFVGREAARRLVAAYDVRQRAGRPVVRVEDAFVGILARESGLQPRDISELVQDPPVGRRQEPALFGGQLLVHRVHDFEKAFEWIMFPVRPSFDRELRLRARGGGAKGGGGGRHRVKRRRAS